MSKERQLNVQPISF